MYNHETITADTLDAVGKLTHSGRGDVPTDRPLALAHWIISPLRREHIACIHVLFFMSKKKGRQAAAYRKI